ncbi:head GIN domain-containing protein [Changchengzhania lutea]|uniref:head GIN domain-containing protein n=1 Tax=Changchengzhania lutea TaxID=2049305 RepID=UPI00115CCA29|nr:head GIN domain-containing protein [Changchengzhania lutea]
MRKQLLLTLASILFISTGYAQWGKSIKGNGKIKTETRTTSNYDAVTCAGSMDFILVSGKEGDIKIKGDENLLEYIVTEVKNNALIVKVKKGKSIYSKKGIVITIPFEDINKVSLAGSGDLMNEDTITTRKFHVSLSGSGDIKLDVKTDAIESAIAGSGDITLEGLTNTLKVKVAGSGDFHGFDLQANDTEVSIAGSGDVKVVSNTNLKASVVGSGDIVYKGSPKLDTKITGSGSISN